MKNIKDYICFTPMQESRIRPQQGGCGSLGRHYSPTAYKRTWARLIKQHTELETLDSETLLTLIDKIIVGESKVVDGQRVRDINIEYRYVGNIEKLELREDEIGFPRSRQTSWEKEEQRSVASFSPQGGNERCEVCDDAEAVMLYERQAV